MPEARSPVVLAHQAKRAQSAQLRVADAITAFAGSMLVVYLHAVVLAVWMLLGAGDPWPRLTLIVSLEAIFLRPRDDRAEPPVVVPASPADHD